MSLSKFAERSPPSAIRYTASSLADADRRDLDVGLGRLETLLNPGDFITDRGELRIGWW